MEKQNKKKTTDPQKEGKSWIFKGVFNDAFTVLAVIAIIYIFYFGYCNPNNILLEYFFFVAFIQLVLSSLVILLKIIRINGLFISGDRKVYYSFKNWIHNHLYIYLLVLSLLYLGFYTFYYYTTDTEAQRFDATLRIGKEVAIIIFSAGIFTAALKYLQFIRIFENSFKEVILSDQFDEKIGKHFNKLAYSAEFLNKQANIVKLYERITFSLYKSRFPELMPRLKGKLRAVYLNKMINSYYYKNYRIIYEINHVRDSLVKIITSASFTVVRHDISPFVLEFGVNMMNTEVVKSECRIKYKSNSQPEIFGDDTDIEGEVIDNVFQKRVSIKMEGKKEYHMEKTTTVVTDLNVDREHSFTSDRIVDDLSFRVIHSENLGIFISRVGQNKFYQDNTIADSEIGLISRDVLLPGEKFKIFIFRNGE